MTLEQAGSIKNTEIAKELCLPPVKLHCSSAYHPSHLQNKYLPCYTYSARRGRHQGCHQGLPAQEGSPLCRSLNTRPCRDCECNHFRLMMTTKDRDGGSK